MSDYTLGGMDEIETAELRGLHAEVLANPDDYEAWQKLVAGAEALEGGLNRNSNPQSIKDARQVYDRFLAKFPLFFGYWKKYADLEFAIAGTEAAEMVYERGVASIGISVDLWANYCAFKVETNHDQDMIRELFERGAASVGLDYLAHPFWDKYIEFEERFEAHDKVFALVSRVMKIPMHQYARYFDKYRTLCATRPVTELAPPEILAAFQAEVQRDPALHGHGELEIERALRARLDQYHIEVFNNTQVETTKRWTYEQNIKRPYFHVTELDDEQLENWHKYLDFEESEGDYTRIAFLYERCVVTCAQYDDFWTRYVRWMYAQEGHDEEVRNIYQRASCLYVPIAKPAIRVMWALFEEMSGRPSIASAIYEAILISLPGHLEAVIGLANLQRRQVGHEAAMQVYQHYISGSDCAHEIKGALVASMASLAYKAKADAEQARALFRDNSQKYLDSQSFWDGYLGFEMSQPTTTENEEQQYHLIKAVHDDIRRKSQLSPEVVKGLSQKYMTYLTERSDQGVAQEYLDLDAEVNGPLSIIPTMRAKGAAMAKAGSFTLPLGTASNEHVSSS
ncbi:hypothetical protein AAFC00_003780 [Neodothiora populina]|uniref:Pre-mRNA-processing factor 39 n=1 Tax=Neodothiora populina TaxID=2781224 RepID=A0ABR3PFE9_9PEZI